MRIAQMVVAPYSRVEWNEVLEITGFGARRGRLWINGIKSSSLAPQQPLRCLRHISMLKKRFSN